jgi:hypothetical protein
MRVFCAYVADTIKIFVCTNPSLHDQSVHTTDHSKSDYTDYINIIILLHNIIIQSVPLATKPGISLIILPVMRILQWNLKRTYLIV